MRSYFFKFFIIFLTISCDPQEILVVKEIEKESAWRAHPKFTGITKIKLNSYSGSDKLYLYGPDFFSEIGANGSVIHSFTFLKYPGFFKLPISNDFFAETSNELGIIRFASSSWPVYSLASTDIDMNKLDENFLKFDLGIFYSSTAMVINSLNQILVPIETKTRHEAKTAYIFSLEVFDFNKLRVIDTIKVEIPDLSDIYTRIYKSFALDEYFLVSHESGVFKISSTGLVQKVFDKNLVTITKHGSRIYGWRQFGEVYLSEDNGNSWTGYTGFPDELTYANYSSVGDSLVVSRFSQIFTLKVGDNKFFLRELDNGGLVGHDITSLEQFKDSVYVTSYSGVFMRHKMDLFKSKPK